MAVPTGTGTSAGSLIEAPDCSRGVHYAPRSMSLDVLAPDQRAVVQLVLQQDRSYEELAGLLGIAPEAVRDRARRGLERLAPDDGLTDDERGELADYLLGQQSVSGRETTRAL